MLVKLDGCIADKFCDITTAMEKFCPLIYEWHTLTRLDGATYGKIIETVANIAKSKGSQLDLLRQIGTAAASREEVDESAEQPIQNLIAYCDRTPSQASRYHTRFSEMFFAGANQ